MSESIERNFSPAEKGKLTGLGLSLNDDMIFKLDFGHCYNLGDVIEFSGTDKGTVSGELIEIIPDFDSDFLVLLPIVKF